MIWTPDGADLTKPHQVGEATVDDETFPVELCGGIYGEKKGEGKAVRVRKGATGRVVVATTPKSRLVWTRDGYVQTLEYGPCSEEGVWRPISHEENPT